MRMMDERRAPGVEDGGQADACAQMLRIGGDCDQRLGGCPEQKVVHGRLVLQPDGADRGRQGEDEVIVGNRQQLGLAVFKPLPRRAGLTLRAVAVAAGVVGDPFVRTVLTALDVSAERRGPAGLDRRHHFQLSEAHVTGVRLAPSRAIGAKDVGDLEGRPRHAGLSGRRRSAREVDPQPLQRALDVADRVDGDTGVERRRLQLRVSEQGHAIVSIFLCH